MFGGAGWTIVNHAVNDATASTTLAVMITSSTLTGARPSVSRPWLRPPLRVSHNHSYELLFGRHEPPRERH